MIGATSQAQLHGVIAQGCKAFLGGGMFLLGDVFLFDVGIEDCFASEQAPGLQAAGSLHADRVRVERCIGKGVVLLWGTSTWTDSTFVDCSAGPTIASGAQSFTRMSIL